MKAALLDLTENPLVSAAPLYADPFHAGFPSPARDHLDGQLDFNELMIKRPAATYALRAEGHSMVKGGIAPGDYLVVDRSIEAMHGCIVVAAVDGDFLVKRLQTSPCMKLVAMSDDHPNFKETKGKRSHVVCYNPEIAPVLVEHLHALRNADRIRGSLFRSESDRTWKRGS